MFKRILVPLDGSKAAEAALEPATYLAGLSGGELLLVRVHSLPDLGFPSEYPVPAYAFEAERKHCETYLMGVAGRVQEGGLQVRWQVLDNALSVAEQIVDAAAEEKSELIVLTSHGRSGVGRFFLGSVAENVARLAPCPVMIVGRQSVEHELAREKAAVSSSGG